MSVIKAKDQGTDSIHLQTLNCLTWTDQIEYILNIEIDYDDQNLIQSLKNQYEHINHRLFESDRQRYMFLYLQTITLNQALNLYDSMNEISKLNLINVIEIDYPHLLEIVNIHYMLNPKCINSIITTTIQ